MQLTQRQRQEHARLVLKARRTLEELNEEIEQLNRYVQDNWIQRIEPTLEQYNDALENCGKFAKEVSMDFAFSTPNVEFKKAWQEFAIIDSGIAEPEEIYEEVDEDVLEAFEALPLEEPEVQLPAPVTPAIPIDKEALVVEVEPLVGDIHVDCAGGSQVHAVLQGRMRFRALMALGVNVVVFCGSCRKRGVAKRNEVDGVYKIEWEE